MSPVVCEKSCAATVEIAPFPLHPPVGVELERQWGMPWGIWQVIGQALSRSLSGAD